MKEQDLSEHLTELDGDAAVVAEMSEAWIVNVLSSAGKNLAAIREGIDDLIRHEAVMSNATHPEPVTDAENLEVALAMASVEQLAAAIPGYFDGDDILKLVDLLKAEVREPAGQLGRDAQLELAMSGATTDEVINALFASFDGDDVVQIIGGLTAMMDHMQEVAAEKAA